MITGLVPGQILLINNYQLRNFGGRDKLRWFIFLGKALPEIDNEDIHYFCTTTTFRDQQKLDRNQAMTFKPPPFDQDCFVYFQEALHEMSLQYLETQARSGAIDLSKGSVSKEQLKLLYLGYWNLELVSPVILKRVKATVVRNEVIPIADLPEPKSKNKKRR